MCQSFEKYAESIKEHIAKPEDNMQGKPLMELLQEVANQVKRIYKGVLNRSLGRVRGVETVQAII